MTRLIQLHDGKTRRIALVQEPQLRLLNDFGSIYELAQAAIETKTKLPALIEKHLGQYARTNGNAFAAMNQGIELVAPSACATRSRGLTAGLEPPTDGCEWQERSPGTAPKDYEIASHVKNTLFFISSLM